MYHIIIENRQGNWFYLTASKCWAEENPADAMTFDSLADAQRIQDDLPGHVVIVDA